MWRQQSHICILVVLQEMPFCVQISFVFLIVLGVVLFYKKWNYFDLRLIEALDNFSLIPHFCLFVCLFVCLFFFAFFCCCFLVWFCVCVCVFFFFLSWEFYTISRLFLCNRCIFLFTCNFNSVTRIWIFLSSAISKSRLQKIPLQWPMGHSGDEVNHKRAHQVKSHWPNQMKISVLLYFEVLYGTRYKKIFY